MNMSTWLSNLRVEFADYSRLNADHIVVLLVVKVSQRLQEQFNHNKLMSGVTVECASVHNSKGKILNNSISTRHQAAVIISYLGLGDPWIPEDDIDGHARL